MKIVLVEWIDSCHLGGSAWKDMADAKAFAKEKPMVCQSVGFVVGDNKHSLTLAESVSAHQTAEHIKIPKAAIRWKKELKP